MIDPEIDAEAFRRLEQSLMQPEIRASLSHLHALLADNFHEIGRSGRTYDKSGVMSALVGLPHDGAKSVPEMLDFSAQQIATGVVLVTYRIAPDQGDDGASRSSLWVQDGGEWRMRFHQATPLPPTP